MIPDTGASDDGIGKEDPYRDYWERMKTAVKEKKAAAGSWSNLTRIIIIEIRPCCGWSTDRRTMMSGDTRV